MKAFETLNPASPFAANWHLDVIEHALEEVRDGRTKRLIINVPPRSLKSTIISVAFPAFLMGHNPSERIVCISYSRTLSSKLSRDTRTILESDWYRRIFPHTVLEKGAEAMLETTRRGCRIASSVEAGVTGLGGNITIIDDPITPDEAPSEAAREKVLYYYHHTLYGRLDDKVNGKIVVVAQRLHEDDLCGHLMRNGDFTSLVIPAIATHDQIYDLSGGRKHFRKAGDVLHPAREPQSELDKQRRSLGSAGFEAQYQQNPLPPDGNMVKKAWVKTYLRVPDRGNGRIVQSWDTAMKGNPANDYSVCTTWLKKDNRHYLLDVFREKPDFPSLAKAVQAVSSRYSPNAVLIEDKGSGTSLIQHLKIQSGVPIIPIKVSSATDKETRLAAVLPMFEAGMVVLPQDAPWSAELERELFGFPNARHDDQVDSITQYLNWARDSALPTFEADFGFDDAPTHADIADRLLWARGH
jgi:predicted phage terminase large subunit-like protein